ncbi:MAG: hypothetical protein E7Z69_00905 [Thermoplasmata archaeon]|nr:hypothetical protein [Thermoplasmata archaeon]
MPNPYIIVISCVTTETVMVSSPSIFYKADEVHLFRYIRDPGTASAKLYEDHFQSVCRQIRSSLPECLVTEHTDDPVYDLSRMVRALSVLYSRIRKEHPDAEVHANLSSGPSEFIAALGIFAFLNPDVKLFKVATRRYTVGAEEFMLLHYDGDGTTKGESAAEMKFLETMDKEGGFYESSGMGSCAKDALDFFVEDHYVIVVDTPEDVCVSCICEGKYDGIPFPFSETGEEYIRRTHEFLRSRTFRRWCVDIPVLWVDGMLPLEEQARAVEEFAGL